MQRPARLIATLGLLAAAACGDSTTTAPEATQSRVGTSASEIDAGTCTTIDALKLQAEVVFGAGSPNYNSVRGKLDNLQHHINTQNFAEAKVRAHDIVEFVLGKHAEGGLPGTTAQLIEFLNNVYCFAGLEITITDPSNTALIFPNDEPQVVYSAGAQTGISFDADPVFAPTLITFAPIPNSFPNPGQGPLDTKLDQYPGFIAISAQSEGGSILKKPAVVGVCATGVIPQAVRDRLRLGHGASAGFEVTPAADAGFLNCPNEVAEAGRGSFWRSVAKLILPTPLHARTVAFFAGGGVGGTVTEFSPFAPVDPELSFGGGVGGTVTEFIREAPAALLLSGTLAASTHACEPIEAPVGTPVAEECLPFVRIQTRLGTQLANVPVTWAVTEGGGSIARRTEYCGASGSSFSGTTSTSGVSAICWTLGAAGLNRVTATPSAGGDAPLGVVFTPAVNTFDAIANPAVGLAFIQVPTSVVAGAPFAVTVNEVDKYGNRVLGANDPVTLTLNQFTFAGGSASATVSAVEGQASFPALVINKAASGYVLTGTAPFLQPPQVLPTSGAFAVVPAAASAMTIVQGNGQSVPAGTVVPIAPTVRVADAFDNAIAGASVLWTAGLSSSGSVSPGTSTTSAAGQASTAWTLGAGDNQLRAELGSNGAIAVVFDAFGITDLAILNSCPVGGSKDPINDPTKPYAFYIPAPKPNESIREIQLHFSSAGRANEPTPYTIELTTQRGTFDPAVSAPITTRATVMLRGNNSENKTATFTLSQPIAGQGGNSSPVMVRLKVVGTNPDNATITFNTGPCPPGTNCKVPKGCNATEVSNPLPYPLGAFYRNSVGITVRGY